MTPVSYFMRLSLAAVCAATLFATTVSAATPDRIVPPGTPQYLIIPKLGVHASVEQISMLNPQDVHAPYRWSDVAWSSFGPRPGQHGNAAIFGHVDSTCCPAVFYRLRDLRPGDQLQVDYRNNQGLRFRVMWGNSYPNDRFPVKWLYGHSHERGLVLITCTGDFHRDGTGYQKKLVVYARLILPNGTLG